MIFSRSVTVILLVAVLGMVPSPSVADHPDLHGYDDLLAVLQQWQALGVEVTAPVQSEQGRDIPLVRLRTGPVTVLYLGALHANEPTGTEAFIRFVWALLGDLDPAFDQPVLPAVDRRSPVFAALVDPVVRAELLQRVTILGLPMLDPDGVEAGHQRNSATNLDYLTQVTRQSEAIQDAVDRHHPDVILDSHGGPDSPDLNIGLVEPVGTDTSVMAESRRIAASAWRAATAAGVTVAYFEEHPLSMVGGLHGEPLTSLDEAYYGSITRTVPLLQESYQLEGIPLIYTETVGLQSGAPSISIAEGTSGQLVSMAALALSEAGLVTGEVPGGIAPVRAPEGPVEVVLEKGATRLFAALRWRTPGADATLALRDASGMVVAVAEDGEDPPTGRRSRTLLVNDLPAGRYELIAEQSGVPVPDAVLRAVWTASDPASALAPGVLDDHTTVRLCTPGESLWSQTVPDHLAGPRCGVVERQSGGGRVETAVNVSRRTFERADAVVLARADSAADALAGAPLAASRSAPLLLTDGAALSPAVRQELLRLRASEVLVLGGEAAVAPGVVTSLRDLGVAVERIAGDDRHATAAAVAGRLPAAIGVVLAEGDHVDPARGWPDAMSGAALGAVTDRPVLLTSTEALPAATREFLAETAEVAGEDGRVVTIVGGETAVSAAVAEEVAALGWDVVRLGGATRYATSAATADAALDPGASAAVVQIVTGRAFPDALAAAAAAGATEGLLVLVDGHDLAGSPETAELLQRLAPDVASARLVGGRSALTAVVEGQVAAMVAGG